MAVYADEFDAQQFGLSGNGLDDYLEVASRVVDAFCGQAFGPAVAQTVTVTDVRSSLVLLPTPFSAVTAVTINGGPVDASLYTVEPWGLRIGTAMRDVDGFPWRLAGLSFFGHPRRGATVSVTATFGWAEVPSPVRQATLIIAEMLMRPTTVANVDGEGNADLAYVRPTPEPMPGPTTGAPEADRLLRPYRRAEAA